MFYSVILAGGSGTRLWPLSRASSPKFLHALTGTEFTLLQATAERLRSLSESDQTYVVTGVAHAEAVASQLPAIPKENFLIESVPRDSCAAIGLACAAIAAHDREAVIGVFSADHLIGDTDRFTKAIRQAIRVAEAGYITTIGIKPDRPETGYGYLRARAEIMTGARLVTEFKEKPPAVTAEAYLESGDYLWNAGMFVFRVREFMAELALHEPGLHRGLTEIMTAWNTPSRDAVLARTWPELKKISVDYAVMEPAGRRGRVATVLADFPWTDIGDFNSLGESLPADDAGNVVVAEPGTIVLRDARDSVILGSTARVIAVIDVENLVVVETSDAILICPRSRAHEVKQVVETLRAQGLTGHI